MSKIIIRTAVAIPRSIRGKNNGPSFNFNEQNAAIMKDGEDFPHPFRIRLDDGQPPYPAGEYTVDGSSFVVGQYGDLQMGRRVVLVPIPTAPATASAGRSASAA